MRTRLITLPALACGLIAANACTSQSLIPVPMELMNRLRINSSYYYAAGRFTWLNGPGETVNAEITSAAVDTANHIVEIRGKVVGTQPEKPVDKITPADIVLAVGELLEVRGQTVTHLQWSDEPINHGSSSQGDSNLTDKEHRKDASESLSSYIQRNPPVTTAEVSYVKLGNNPQMFLVGQDGEFDVRAHITPNSYLVITAPRYRAVLYQIGKLLLR